MAALPADFRQNHPSIIGVGQVEGVSDRLNDSPFSLTDAAASYFLEKELYNSPYGMAKERYFVRNLSKHFNHLPTSNAELLRYAKARIAVGISHRTCDLECGLLARIAKHHGVALTWRRLPRRPVHRPYILTPTEKARLLHVAGTQKRWKWARLALTVILNSGMRVGEVMRLKWKDVDFAEGILRVSESKTAHGKLREIPFNDDLLDALRELQTLSRGCERVFRVRNIGSAWRSMTRAANVPKFSPHAGRHLVATELASNPAVSQQCIIDLLGWKDTKLLTEVYCHISRETRRSAVTALSTRNKNSGDSMYEKESKTSNATRFIEPNRESQPHCRATGKVSVVIPFYPKTKHGHQIVPVEQIKREMRMAQATAQRREGGPDAA